MKRVCFLTILIPALQLAIAPVPAVGQLLGASKTPSFGSVFGRKTVSLHRRLPPVVNVSGKSVAVTVEEQRGDTTGAELQSAIENLLTRSESGVRVVTSGADVVIDCRISEYTQPRIQTTTEDGQTSQYITGELSAVFRITQPRSSTLIASGVASTQVDSRGGGGGGVASMFSLSSKSSGPKMDSTTDGQNALLADASRQIAGYLVQTDENVNVMLAVGAALTPANKLAQTNLWSRDLEELETLTPYPDPRLDAYRIYNIGVANEALAYQAQDAKAAVKYLQEASIDYGKALADRPDEKYFLEPQNRIKTGLAHYSVTSETASAVAPGKPADTSLTNEDVIALVGAKMDQANILDTIQSAPAVNFDLSVSGMVTLTRSGVNGTILSAMKAKAKKAATSSAPAK